jgi:hypothetical protein
MLIAAIPPLRDHRVPDQYWQQDIKRRAQSYTIAARATLSRQDGFYAA